MAWSRVDRKTKKPLMWWYNKIMCEYHYHVGNYPAYHRHLNIMCNKYRLSLYGVKI
jgi:hypothetical protein